MLTGLLPQLFVFLRGMVNNNVIEPGMVRRLPLCGSCDYAEKHLPGYTPLKALLPLPGGGVSADVILLQLLC